MPGFRQDIKSDGKSSSTLSGEEGNPEALLPDSGCPPRVDGEGSRPEAVARIPRQAVSGSRHENRQVESIRSRTRGLRAIRKEGVETAAVLGRDRPGSEGNLASDNENNSTTVGAPPQENRRNPRSPPQKAARKPAHGKSGQARRPETPEKAETRETERAAEMQPRRCLQRAAHGCRSQARGPSR